MSKTKVLNVRKADDNHQVVTVKSDDFGYMKKPCPDCPWRKDSVGVFPPEAFRHSASTSYDMSQKSFACHSAGVKSSKICAGFLLKGAEHNLSIRLKRMKGDIKDDIKSEGIDLFDGYKDMAIANGVDRNDICLKKSRS